MGMKLWLKVVLSVRSHILHPSLQTMSNLSSHHLSSVINFLTQHILQGPVTSSMFHLNIVLMLFSERVRSKSMGEKF